MDWKQHARQLADQIADPDSRWHQGVAEVPRHLFTPRWFRVEDASWTVRDGAADAERWLRTAYGGGTVVTRIGALHADSLPDGFQTDGVATSSATEPALVLRMFRHARLHPGRSVLDIGTGSGYGCALLAHRLGDDRVTSIDVDPYLTATAAERLAETGLNPTVLTCDATGELPGVFDRLVSTLSVRPVPKSWLAALRPGGRLVTVVAGTPLIITADKADDGTAIGRVEPDQAGFMRARSTPDYPPGLDDLFAAAATHESAEAETGRYPITNVIEGWDLWAMMGVTAPGTEYRYEQEADTLTTYLAHPDGSWAAAQAGEGSTPTVYQGGPRRLWDILDDIRHRWLCDGSLPIRNAKVTITPDGTIHLRRGRWKTEIAQ